MDFQISKTDVGVYVHHIIYIHIFYIGLLFCFSRFTISGVVGGDGAGTRLVLEGYTREKKIITSKSPETFFFIIQKRTR